MEQRKVARAVGLVLVRLGGLDLVRSKARSGLELENAVQERVLLLPQPHDELLSPKERERRVVPALFDQEGRVSGTTLVGVIFGEEGKRESARSGDGERTSTTSKCFRLSSRYLAELTPRASFACARSDWCDDARSGSRSITAAEGSCDAGVGGSISFGGGTATGIGRGGAAMGGTICWAVAMGPAGGAADPPSLSVSLNPPPLPPATGSAICSHELNRCDPAGGR